MKKMFTVILCLSMVFAMVIPASACEADTTKETNKVYINLSEMEVGESVVVGDLVFEKAPDDVTVPSHPGARATTEGFSISNFGGNTTVDKSLVLNSTYRYFWIRVDNEGAKMSVSISKNGTHEYFTEVDTGSLYIYSTQAWSAGTHTVSFSCGSGLQGGARAVLCSSLDEAKAHN